MLPIYYSDLFLEHQTGPAHPERPARLEAITYALKAAPFADRLDWRHPQAASPEVIGQVHPPEYVQGIQRFAEQGGGHIDADTVVSSQSYQAACLAVGGWLDGIQTVLRDQAPAVVLCRPPGHHAEPQRGMGFCLFSNAAIAALWALDQVGIERVAILDWDVHHGNGTQAVAEQHPRLVYLSLHQAPLYPGTGSATEIGPHDNIRNFPLPAGSDWSVYSQVWATQVVPFLRQIQPDLLLVSAGFDCAQGDPLASMSLVPEDFGRMAQMCLEITPKTLFGLEGGYDLENLAHSWISVVQTCLSFQNSVRT